MKITEELLNKFKLYLTKEEKSSSTIEKYMRDITAFTFWAGERVVDKIVVLEYKEYLKQKYACTSVNSVLSSLNSFFEFNEWYNLRVKTIKIQRQIFANKNKELSKAEYLRLLTAAKTKKNKKLYLIMQTICATGIRVSELKFITVEGVKKSKATINLKGKFRVIMIPDALCKMLLNYTREQGISNGTIFVSRNGNPLDRSNIWKLMRSLCEIAGVSKEKVFPHNLRHLFARTFYSVQKDIVRLADLLGHASVNTTRIYTMETGEIHRKQIQKLGLLKC